MTKPLIAKDGFTDSYFSEGEILTHMGEAEEARANLVELPYGSEEAYLKKCVETCALGEECACAGQREPKPWLCVHWAKSSLPSPAYVHSSDHYTGKKKADVLNQLGERQRKHEAHHRKTEERLANIRREDPRKYFAKKGVKVAR